MNINDFGISSPINGIVFPGDFNGNGYSDLLVLPPRPSGGYNSSHKWRLFINDKNGNFDSTTVIGYLNNALTWIYVADFNGDGKDDFLYVQKTSGSPLTINPFISMKSEIGFDQKPSILVQHYYGSTEQILVGDFEGEGKASFIVKRSVDPNNWYYYRYNNVTESFPSISDKGSISNWGDETYTADFNGDGKTDIMVVRNDTTRIYSLIRENYIYTLDSYYVSGFPTKWHRIFIDDFNGDRKSDLLTWSPESLWNITFFKDTVFHWPSIPVNDLPQSDPGKYANSLSLLHETWPYLIRLADFNGDGKSDILTLRRLSNHPVPVRKLKIYYSPINLDTSQNIFSKIDTHDVSWKLNTNNQNLFLGNFYGNGCAVVIGTFNIEYYNPSLWYLFPTILYNFHPNDNQYCISSIADGLSNTTSFTFEFMPRSSNYSKDPNTGIITELIKTLFPVRILTQMVSDHISGLPEITTYNYNNAKLHREGKGWLGFETIKTYNNKSNFTVRKDFGVLSERFVPVLKRDSVFISENAIPANLLSATLLNYQEAQEATSDLINHKILIPQMIHRLNHIWEKPGVFLKTELHSFEYDNLVGPNVQYYWYNNIIKHYVLSDPQKRNSFIHNAYKYRSIHEYIYLQDNYYTNNWLLTMVDSVLNTTSIKEVIGSDLTSRTEFQYYPSGHNHHPLPKFKKIIPDNNPDDKLVTLVELSYDLAGNLTQSSLSAPNYEQPLPTRSSSIEYSPQYQYRFPTSTSNPLGYTTSRIYDPQFGWLTSSTDFNELTTGFSHHPLGINSGIVYSDGKRQLKVLRWVNNHIHAPDHNGEALYYSWSEVSGQAEVLTFYNKSGLELRTVSYGFNGNPIYIDRYYDQNGRLQQESLPYFPDDVIHYTQYDYDNIGRLEITTYPDNTFTSKTYSGNTITTTNHLQQTTKQTYNAAGWLVESEDAAGTKVNYDYFSDGKLKSAWIMNQPQTAVNIEYDSQRRRSELQDPNYGTATYKYNPFGELVMQVSPRNDTTTYTYDILGRMLTQTEPEGTTQWIYEETPGRIGTLQNVQNSVHKTTYAYDDLLRLTAAAETINGDDYQTSYTYDVYGRVNTTTHPSGFAVKNVYNQYGYRTQIRSAQNKALLWQTDEVTAVGQVTDFRTGNALATYREFEPETQRLTGIYTGKTGQNPVQNLGYLWDEIGNLKQRKTNIHNLIEFFTYDNLNRLETIRLNGTIRGEHQYDPNGLGNLIYKKADGQILFSNAAYGENEAGPHALTSATTSAGIFPPQQQTIAYNSFDKAVSISEGNKQLQITYGHHRQRITQQYTEGGNTIDKVWAGACEYNTENGLQKTLTYLSGPEGVFALHVKNPNGTENIRYIHKDHLGSWHTITDKNGNLLQELSFDAWGNRRDSATWRSFTGTPPEPLFDRGFTGHEHLFGFSLVNMNGRLYDPVVSRMLSPDNFIQAPDFSQSFNRYSYVLNNPLIYTDPSGEIIFTILAAVFFPPLLPVTIGADIGWMTGGTRAVSQGETFWYGAWRGGLVGAVGGGLSMIGGAGMTFGANLGLGIGQGAATGGLDAALWGNDIGKGMLYGAAVGAVFTTLTSENFSNTLKGEGFYTNENVFNNMIERRMDKQGMLDYFGFEGEYNPNITSKRYQASDYWGATNIKTGKISYGNLAFEDYATLKGTYIKESFHSQKILNGMALEKLPDDLQGLGMDTYLEEIDGYMHMYKNQGLFKGHNMPMKVVEFYQSQLKLFDVSYPTYPSKFQWIYQIPRRW